MAVTSQTIWIVCFVQVTLHEVTGAWDTSRVTGAV